MTEKTVITMEKNRITVDSYSENGMKSTKNTNLENLQQVFLKEQALETPLLPSQWGVVKYYRKNNYEGYVMTTPPTVREVSFDPGCLRSDEQQHLNFPVPPLVWIFEVRENQNGQKVLSHSMVYALKHELLSFNDNVYHLPTPNIGIGHGICWGSEIPNATVAKSLQNLPARFFSQRFNRDLSTDRVRVFELNGHNTNSVVDFMQMVGKQYEEDPENFSFPYDLLKPVGNYKVKDVVKSYLPGLQ